MQSEPSSGIKLTAYSCICWLFHRIQWWNFVKMVTNFPGFTKCRKLLFQMSNFQLLKGAFYPLSHLFSVTQGECFKCRVPFVSDCSLQSGQHRCCTATDKAALSTVISLAANKYNQKPPYEFTEDDFEIYNRLTDAVTFSIYRKIRNRQHC